MTYYNYKYVDILDHNGYLVDHYLLEVFRKADIGMSYAYNKDDDSFIIVIRSPALDFCNAPAGLYIPYGRVHDGKPVIKYLKHQETGENFHLKL